MNCFFYELNPWIRCAFGNVLKGVWRQYDGSMVPWTPWWRDGKNGGRRDNCALISLIINDDTAGDWVDYDCNKSGYYICEKDQ